MKAIIILAIFLTFFVVISYSQNNVLYNITTIVGTGGNTEDYTSGLPTSVELNKPCGVATSLNGEVYIADTYNNRILKVDIYGYISIIAGTGDEGFGGDGGLATSAVLNRPLGIAVSSNDEVYIADSFNNRIRKINTLGIITTIAGNGNEGFSGDGGLATTATFRHPYGIAISSKGEVYIADYFNHVIRKIDTNGIIFTIAGTGAHGFSGDGGLATSSTFSHPYGVAINANDEVYIGDVFNNRVRKVNTLGIITTIAGTGNEGFSGDGGLATSARIFGPHALAIGPNGEVYFADRYNNRIRKIDTNGNISTIAGTGVRGFSGDGGLATSARLNNPISISLSSSGEILVVDLGNNRIRKLTPWCAENRVLMDGICEYKCFGLTNNHSEVCSGKGQCIGNDYCNCTSNYFGTNCEEFNCFDIHFNNSLVCSGNGICSSLNNCSCENEFYGSNCELYDCFGISKAESQVCSGQGICSSFNNCTCSDGYYGSNCDMYDCYGLSKSESNICSGHGNCSSLDNCTCEEDYSGANCEHAKCFKVPKDDPEVCSSHGECSSLNNCSCFDGFFGSTCDEFNCFDIHFNNSFVCSGHGTCSSLNNCTCEQGYTGSECELITCFGKLANDSHACNRNGVCKGPNTCECFTPSSHVLIEGSECEQIKCLGSNNTFMLSTDPKVCSNGRGKCEFNGCNCTEGYFGEYCQLFTCNEVIFNESNVCSGHGTCSSFNNCTCENGYYGSNCEMYDCFGISRTKTSVCSGHGQCSSFDNCTCENDYYGSNCEEFNCFETSYNHSTVCSNLNGQCVSPNHCVCYNGYTGSECELITCFGKLTNDSHACNSNGVCKGPNNCSCFTPSSNVLIEGSECEQIKCLGSNNTFMLSTDPKVCSNGRGKCEFNGCNCTEGYFGEYCQLFTCNEVIFNESNVCSGHGTCSSFNNCTCENGYYGSNCEIYNCFGILKSEPNACSGNGQCLDLNYCLCNQNIQSGFWNGSDCNECQTSYFGSKCSTRTLGPAKFLDNYSGIKFQLIGPISYTKTQVNCSNLVSISHIYLFGSKPICSWTNRSSNEFTIKFGDNFSLKPEMKVKFNRLVFDHSNKIEEEELIIYHADNPVKPTVILSSGKTLIGSCETFNLDASKSFSEDLNPLKYEWVMISSPNNLNIFIDLGNSSSIELNSSSIPLEGEYKIGVQVKSTISNAISDVEVWTFTKSSTPLPILSIIGLKEKTIYKSESPIVLKKSLITPSCFHSDKKINIVWKQSSGPESTFEIDNFDNIAITHFSSLNESIYEYTVEATSIVDPMSTTFETVKITVKPTPMTLILYTDEVSSESGKIVAELIDPDQTIENELWKWSCWDSSNNYECSQEIKNMLLTKSNEKSSFIDITDQLVQTYSTIPTFKITLHIIKGFRMVESVIDFKLPELNKIPPTINLISIIPSRNIIAKGQIVNLQLQVTANGQSIGINEHISREWTLNNQLLKSGDPFLSLMTINPSLSNSIVLDTFYLEEGMSYDLSLKVTDNRNSMSEIYTHTFNIALPPKTCPCTITPEIGTALETSFTFSCANCQNSEQSLRIIYGFIDDKTGALIELYTQGGSFTSKLPCSSSPLINKNVPIFFKIIDTLSGSFTEIRKDVTIEVPSARSLTEARRKVSGWTSYQNSLKDGDSALTVFNTATISRTSDAMIAKLTAGRRRILYQQSACQNGGFWNEERNGCDCPTDFAKIDCSVTSDNFTIYKEIRKDLMKDFVESFKSRNRHDLITESYLTSIAFGLDSLIERFDEVDDDDIENGIQILKVLMNPSNFNNVFRIPFGVDKLLSNTINNIYRYLQYQKKESKVDTFELLKQLSKLTLKGMFIGERDKQIDFSFAKLSTNKMFRYNFESKIISTSNQSFITLPQTMPLYLSEKSNRRSISFISILTSDIYGIVKKLGQPLLLESDLRNINNSIISTNVTSIKYLRSDILLLKLIDSTTENIVNPIKYRFKYFSLQNYTTEDSLINSTQIDQTITNIYRTSQFSCVVMNLTTLEIIDGTWCDLELSDISNIATCTCNSTTSVFLIENVIEKRQQIVLQSQEFDIEEQENTKKNEKDLNLGIILGIFGYLIFVALIVGMILLIVFISSMKKKEMIINKVPNKSIDHTAEMKEISNV